MTSTSKSQDESSENDKTIPLGYAVHANKIAEERNSDVILFNGSLNRLSAYRLIRKCDSRKRRKNVLLLLTTFGGDPNAAYIIARHLQANYEHFTLFVSGFCKSAGTLIALGAHKLIISNYGELGPLDVQMSKKDELGEKQSGLVGLDALTQLQRLAYDSFEEFFLTLTGKLQSGLTSQTCAKIATELTNGLFTPIYRQIDPLHLGETGRSMKIAEKYGERLIEKGGNISQDGVLNLVNDYPSHVFVIDRDEAGKLFERVDEPDASEQSLIDSLGSRALLPNSPSEKTTIEIFPHEEERKQAPDSKPRQGNSTESNKRTNGRRRSGTEKKLAKDKSGPEDS